ncbi:MAG TPA: hypothetical protein VFH76_03065 [Kribbella sp.]|nr:hypothetical protein [Kribbella sp.]
MIRLKVAMTCAALVIGLSSCSGGAKPSAGGGPTTDDGRFAVELGEGFHADGSFDARMTCDGEGDYSPPLVFRHVPSGTAELVLSEVDQDERSADGDPVIQWVEWAIPPDSTGLVEHEKPAPAREALSDLHEATYNGPCPASWRGSPLQVQSACAFQAARPAVRNAGPNCPQRLETVRHPLRRDGRKLQAPGMTV